MRRPYVAALTIFVVGAACLLVIRDRQQQKRLGELSDRVAGLSATMRELALPLQALPSFLGQLHCKLDPSDLARLAGATPGKAGAPQIAASPASGSADKARSAELSSDQVAALDRARQRLGEVLSRHRLSHADVLEIRAQLATVGSPRVAEEMRARIPAAINRKEIVPEERPFMMP